MDTSSSTELQSDSINILATNSDVPESERRDPITRARAARMGGGTEVTFDFNVEDIMLGLVVGAEGMGLEMTGELFALLHGGFFVSG